MKRNLFNIAGGLALLPALGLALAGCASSASYLNFVTPLTAADLLEDNVELFVGSTYDEAALLAAEAGYEVILSCEGRVEAGFFASYAKVRLIAQDADGKRPAKGRQ